MIALIALVSSPVALANGQTTHVWISEAAKDELPEGDLRDFVTDEAVYNAIRNGTMFPDGGYATGHPYAEPAHWEPLQHAYLEWIRSNYEPPWTDEAKQHIGFLLGMGSHGLADQSFDALYIERGRQEDATADWSESFDEATDVVWASRTGKAEIPPDFVPAEALIPLYESVHGIEVSADDLEDGQTLLRVALWAVGEAGSDPEVTADYAAEFPWMCSHLEAPEVFGTPPDEALVVARYWEVVWHRLHEGSAPETPVIATFPEDGSYDHPTGLAQIEARASVVFARGLDKAALSADSFAWEGPQGPVPFRIDLFYGQDSHVVHLIPDEALADGEHTVTVSPGVKAWDGEVLGGFAWSFSTQPPPLDDTVPIDAPEDDEAPSCGCAAQSGGPGLGWVVLALWFRRRR